MTGAQILTAIAPPFELIEHLERYQAKAQLPPCIAEYLAAWQDVRGDGETGFNWADVAVLVKKAIGEGERKNDCHDF